MFGTSGDDDNEETDNDAVEPTDDDWALNATLTKPDGTTTTTKQFSVSDLNVDWKADSDGLNEVSAGLSKRIEDVEQEFQLTLEVPTKTITCPNCNHANHVPIWAFVDVSFSGELEALSGEYALGHQCVNCGFPY